MRKEVIGDAVLWLGDCREMQAMLFDLTRWTYRQFYPRCVE